MHSRKDIIFATGRSDSPNQINNVLGFPSIFRGALDVQACGINEEMKLAAAYAIADLTKEAVQMCIRDSNKLFQRNGYSVRSLSDTKQIEKKK